ncbi:MAG: hypothetical protein WKF40_03275 [Thermoleophilaceae bacterium]
MDACHLRHGGRGGSAALRGGADAVVFAAGAGPGSGAERKRTVDLGAAVLERVRRIPAGQGHHLRRPAAAALALRRLGARRGGRSADRPSAGRAPDQNLAGLPWHRVVRADGSLAKGERQRALLDAEGCRFAARGGHARGLGAGRVLSEAGPAQALRRRRWRTSVATPSTSATTPTMTHWNTGRKSRTIAPVDEVVDRVEGQHPHDRGGADPKRAGRGAQREPVRGQGSPRREAPAGRDNHDDDPAEIVVAVVGGKEKGDHGDHAEAGCDSLHTLPTLAFGRSYGRAGRDTLAE